MIVGIEQTTDARDRQTRLVRCHSESAVREWLATPVTLAFPAAAVELLPADQQNWHRRIRDAFDLPPGWRFPTVTAWRKLHHSDRRSLTEYRADAVCRAGIRITVTP